MNAQKVSHIMDALTSNSDLISSALSIKQKQTFTIFSQALEKEKLLKQAKADTHIGKNSSMTKRQN